MGYTLCVLGCGTMGVAILSGVVDSLQPRLSNSPVPKWETHTPGTATPTEVSDETTPSAFIACVSRGESARKLRHAFCGLGSIGETVEVIVGENVKAVHRADVVLLCCKPQVAHSILGEPGMKEALEHKLLISILAGVTIAQMSAWVLPSTKVIRAMPNTPCQIREGMTVVSNLPQSSSSEVDHFIILKIFSSIGRCRFLEEKHFDACTALSGSGPAFACIFLEAMADGGVMMGLPRAEALELAAQSMSSLEFPEDAHLKCYAKALQGAARMTLQTGIHPSQLKDAVTTPGGCTIAGLLTLEDGRVRSTIARAIQIATERASELGQPAKK